MQRGKLWAILVDVLAAIPLCLLSGIALGTSLAVFVLDRFSLIPGSIMLLVPLLVGVSIGVLTRDLTQALVVLLLTIVIYGVINVFSLSFPELVYNRLGSDITIQISAIKAALNSFLYAFPLTLIGILLAKSLMGGD